MVPLEWMGAVRVQTADKKHHNNPRLIHTTPVQLSTSSEAKSCVYNEQIPFTAEDPLVSKSWNAQFFQICWRNKLIYIFDGLRVYFNFGVNNSFKTTFSKKYDFTKSILIYYFYWTACVLPQLLSLKVQDRVFKGQRSPLEEQKGLLLYTELSVLCLPSATCVTTHLTFQPVSFRLYLTLLTLPYNNVTMCDSHWVNYCTWQFFMDMQVCHWSCHAYVHFTRVTRQLVQLTLHFPLPFVLTCSPHQWM